MLFGGKYFRFARPNELVLEQYQPHGFVYCLEGNVERIILKVFSTPALIACLDEENAKQEYIERVVLAALELGLKPFLTERDEEEKAVGFREMFVQIELSVEQRMMLMTFGVRRLAQA